MDLVERTITLPASLATTWELLTQPSELGRWFGDEVSFEATPGRAGSVVDHDGTRRSLVVDEVLEGRRLSWHWWADDDELAAATHVEISLTPTTDGTTVRVVERLAESSPPTAEASAAAAWSHRLLHLETLLLVAAAVRG